eukprot:PITA_21170
MGDVDPSTGGEALNAAPRIRVRARQGHSVAERTDRASMLDEIIDYVELLQMQIKVVSASKLGSVGSFGPLTPNVAAEVHASLLIFTGTSNINYWNSHVCFTLFADAIYFSVCKASASLLQPGGSLFEEGQEFENNIVKFMERDMNGATEYLQSKGLYLIPVPQARDLFDSISNEGRNPGGLGSSRSPVSVDKLNTKTNTSCSRVLGMGSVGSGSDLSSKGNEAIKKGKGLVPTHESNGVDSVIISCLSKIMEKE